MARLARVIGRARSETGGAAKGFQDFPNIPDTKTAPDRKVPEPLLFKSSRLPEETAMDLHHPSATNIDQQHVIIVSHPAQIVAGTGQAIAIGIADIIA